MTYPTARPCQELRFTAPDGAALFYRHWPATAAGADPKALVLLHRGHEHGGRVAHLADEFALPDYDFFAWDQRGLGLSPGARGYADNFGVLVRDLEAFVQHLARAHGLPAGQLVVGGPEALGRRWPPCGCTTTPPGCGGWCWPRPPSKSTCWCPVPCWA